VSTRIPARRVRGRFISFGFWTSVATFVVIEGDAILDQSEIGHASSLFMFGTACLAAAACIALFAIVTAIGLAVSTAFKEEPHQQQSAASDDASGVARAGHSLGQSSPISLAAGRSGPVGINSAAVFAPSLVRSVRLRRHRRELVGGHAHAGEDNDSPAPTGSHASLKKAPG
jgi:hypothetical protein